MFKKFATKVMATAAGLSSGAVLAGPFGEAQNVGTTLTNVDTSTSAWAQLGTIINYFLTLIGLITFIFLLYGGVIILTAQGNEDKVSEARKVIIYAVAGVIVIVLAYAINSWIFKSSFFVQ